MVLETRIIMTHFIQGKFGQCLQISDTNLKNTDSLVKEICINLYSSSQLLSDLKYWGKIPE
jgi:phage gp46-like protein